MTVIFVSRRPIGSGTIASNVIDHGCGAINIDMARIQHTSVEDLTVSLAKNPGRSDAVSSGVYGAGRPQQSVNTAGRWPSNLILEHLPGCTRAGTIQGRAKQLTAGRRTVKWGVGEGDSTYEKGTGARFATEDGTEPHQVWDCQPGCPVSNLDEQSGVSKSLIGAQKYNCASASGWVERGGSFDLGREWEAQGYGDVGGASRFFKQIHPGATVSSEVPESLISYLHTLITPTHVGGETLVALDIGAMDWAAIPDGKYHGVIARGVPTPEQVEHMWRVVRPGAHVLLIAPDSCPTGHRGACALEDRGFEIRDAILWVREAGKLHYVPKANTKERNLGTEKLAAKRKGPPTYELTEEALADEEALVELQEALLEAGLAEDVVEGIVENGLPKDKVPNEHKHLFQKRDGSGKYGNNHPCLHPDTLVMTDRGYRPVTEVRVKDRVLTADGTFHCVTDVSHHPYTSPNLYEIAVQGTNYTTLASDNHPFLIWRPTRSKKGALSGGEVLWLQADEVRRGDYTMTPHLKEMTSLPSLTVVSEDGEVKYYEYAGLENGYVSWYLSESRRVDPDVWFVFGLYIAEGVLHKSKHSSKLYPSFTLHEDEAHLVERIRRVCSKVSVYPKKGAKAVQVIAFDSELGEAFGALGGEGSSTKSFAHVIWELPKEHQRAILEGYLAGDGGRVRDYWQAKTVSPDLASQFSTMAEGLGYKVNLFRFDAEPGSIGGRVFKTTLPHYQLQLYETNRAEGRTRKSSRPTTLEHEGTTFTLRHVKAVTLVPYEGDVWNLSVHGSPTFQTAVGMSHNTVKSREIMVRLLADVPQDAVVMDPFMGSGSTALACLETKHDFVGIEREPDYIEIADARVRYWERAKAGWVDTVIESEASVAVDEVAVDEGGVFDMFD